MYEHTAYASVLVDAAIVLREDCLEKGDGLGEDGEEVGGGVVAESKVFFADVEVFWDAWTV